MTSKDPATPQDAPEATDVNADVVARCRAGNPAAQQAVYEHYHARVYRLMIRMVGLQDATDLTQQVFLQIFRKIDQFAAHSTLSTWVYRLAVNEALQHQRRQPRWKFQPLPTEIENPAGPERERGEDRELLERALDELEPELRSIFLLREVENLSYREIAAIIGVPEGTVGSRLNRARRELRQHLIALGWEA